METTLPAITCPADLKALPLEHLPALAEKIRATLIETHGSMFHRAPGSIGASSYPSRVWKNKALPGHMGDERVTVQRLKVVDARPDENLLFVRGAVPGGVNGLLIVRKSKKS